MRFYALLAIFLLLTSPVLAGSQARPPLTGGAAVELSATNLGTTASTVLVADNVRGFLRIQNVGTANTLACTVDGTAPIINSHGAQIAAGNSLTYDTFVPTGAIVCIGSAANTAYNITYLRGF